MKWCIENFILSQYFDAGNLINSELAIVFYCYSSSSYFIMMFCFFHTFSFQLRFTRLTFTSWHEESSYLDHFIIIYSTCLFNSLNVHSSFSFCFCMRIYMSVTPCFSLVDLDRSDRVENRIFSTIAFKAFFLSTRFSAL